MKKNSKLNKTYKDLWNAAGPESFYNYNYNVPPMEDTTTGAFNYSTEGDSPYTDYSYDYSYNVPPMENTTADTLNNASKIPFLGGNLRYSKANGISIGNPNGTGTLNTVGNNLGKIATGVNLATQGYNLYNNIDSISDAAKDEKTLKAKVLSTAAANPMNSSYLSTDNMRMLRQLRNGTYDADGVNTKDVISRGLGGALKGVLTGAAGGIPGMVIGGVGGAVNGGLSAKSNADKLNNQKLEALLTELEDAQTQYNQMKRPNYNQMGLQSRYTNQWV